MMKTVFAILSLAILAAPALAQDCKAPMAPLKPIGKTHTQPPYPPLSQRTDEEGNTLLEVLIGTDGKVISYKIAASSGSARLDEAAGDYVKANWLWEPPIVNCKPHEVSTRIQITWHLREAPNIQDPLNPTVPIIIAAKTDYPPDAFKRLEQGWTLVTFVLSTTGEISHQVVTHGSGFADLDAKAIYVIKSHRWAAATMDGQPKTSGMAVLVEWTIDGSPPPVAPDLK